MADARSLDHKTLEALRRRGVESVQKGEHPSDVARILGVKLQVVYKWLAMYRAGGWDALRAKTIPGRPRKVSAKAMKWLYETIVTKTPNQLQFDFALWTRDIVRSLVLRKYGIQLSLKSVGKLLAQLGLSVQRPIRSAYEQSKSLVDTWLKVEYPKIAERAKKERATIFFGDEAAVRSDYHAGTTWAPIGKTPVVKTTGRRASCNMLSAISNRGDIRFMVMRGKVNSGVFIEFLKRLLVGAKRKIFLIVDGATSHRSKMTREFVQSTKGKLELFHLPPYSPELNPDELVWNHVKNHKVGRKIILNADDLMFEARSALRSLSKLPMKIKAFFQKPSLQYAA